MAAIRPTSERRPSRRIVVIAFAAALAAAAALVAVAVALRSDNSGPKSSARQAVSLTGIPQSGQLLGNAKANVALIEYADLQCPGCDYYTLNVWPTIVRKYIRTGKVKTEFRGIAFLGPDSLKALHFVFAAALQNKLWQLQDALYRNQGQENSGWVTDSLVRDLAGQIPGLDVTRLFTDSTRARVTAMIDNTKGQADALPVQSTPTLLVQIGSAPPYQVESVFDATALSAALDDALHG